MAKKPAKKKAPKRSSKNSTATAKKKAATKTTAKKKTVKKKATKKATTKKKTVTKKAKKATTKRRPKAKSEEDNELTVKVDRRLAAESDRRQDEDRRQEVCEVESERRVSPERRSKVARRRQIDPTTCERDYSNDEIEFMHALDEYKRRAGRMFPTCSEILEVVRDLGYRRLSPEELAILAAAQNSDGVDSDAMDSESSQATGAPSCSEVPSQGLETPGNVLMDEPRSPNSAGPVFPASVAPTSTSAQPGIHDLAFTEASLSEFEV